MLTQKQAKNIAEILTPGFSSVAITEHRQVIARGYKGLVPPKRRSELVRNQPLRVRNTTLFIHENHLRSPEFKGAVQYHVREALIDRRSDRVISLVQA